MAHASRSIEIQVTPPHFLEVLQDYARYPEFLPEVKGVRLGPREGDRVEVTYQLDVKLKLLEFTLLHVAHGPARIDWKLLRGELMRTNAGSWTLVETAGGGTHATYSIELELGGSLPAGLERALADRGLPSMLENFKARAEKLHGR